MFMHINIIDGETVFDAYEHFDGDFVVDYVTPTGDPIDMAALDSPRIVYQSREVLEALPA